MLDKPMFEPKVLACITPQSNSKRLINKAHEIALAHQAQLHILHVEKGGNLFASEEVTKLLQDLFHYASNLGGVVHGLCSENIADTIIQFIRDEKITHVLLGQPPENTPVKSMEIYLKLITVMPHLDIATLKRDNA